MAKFNCGKFNIKSQKPFIVIVTSEMSFYSKVLKTLTEIYAFKTKIVKGFESEAKGYIEKYGVANGTIFYFDSNSISSNLTFSEEVKSELNFDVFAIGSILGEEYIELENIGLLPGQELEIDMCNLTVTINGDNSIHLLTDNSEFFDFFPGQNEISISTKGEDKMETTIYWKDRWL